MGVNGINTYEAEERKGLATIGDYTTAAASGTGNQDAVQVLIDLIRPEHTMDQRGFLDQMSPTARAQLLVELLALQTAIVDLP